MMLKWIKAAMQSASERSDGYILGDQIVYDVDGGNPVATKGFKVCGPSLEMPVTGLNQVESGFRQMLTVLKPGIRLQVKMSMSSNYKAELLGYHDETQDMAKNDWTSRVRDQEFLRLSEA